MKRILKYSFLFSLLLSIVLILPFGFRQYQEKHTPLIPPMQPQQQEESVENEEMISEPVETSEEKAQVDIRSQIHFDIEKEIQASLIDRQESDKTFDTSVLLRMPVKIPEVDYSDVHEAVYDGAKGKYSFSSAELSYFDDALFIGDSRTEGIRLYSGINNATYFSYTGLNVYAAASESYEVSGIGKVSLQYLLENYSFGKVYLMLGINEIGDDIENITRQYYSIVELINETQPDALIFVEGNMHVGPTRNAEDTTINNYRLNALNYEISKIANNRNVFYIDVNEVFDDENGCLRDDITSDDTHIYAKHYEQWADWLMTKAVLY